MASYGRVGFMQGLSGALEKNLLQNKQEELTKALLMGDIAGSQEGLPEGQRVQVPQAGGGGILQNLLGSIGMAPTGPDMATLIQKRQEVAKKLANYQAKIKQWGEDKKLISDPNVEIDPVLESNLRNKYLGDPLLSSEITSLLDAKKQRKDLTEKIILKLSNDTTPETEKQNLLMTAWTKGIKLPPTLEKRAWEKPEPDLKLSTDIQSELRSMGVLGNPTSEMIQTAQQNITRRKDAAKGELTTDEFKTAARELGLDITKQETWTPEQFGKVRTKVASYRSLEAGGKAEASTTGRERGMQSVLAERIDRIEKEAIAANQGKPLDASVNDRVSNLLSARRQAGLVETNFDKEFLGPVKGTQIAFETRRRVGSYISSPLGAKETVFRQSLADIKDMLLRARSGAQINEQEYKRLSQMLPAATDEEPVFKAGLTRFDNEVAAVIADKIRLGTTPKRETAGKRVRDLDLR